MERRRGGRHPTTVAFTDWRGGGRELEGRAPREWLKDWVHGDTDVTVCVRFSMSLPIPSWCLALQRWRQGEWVSSFFLYYALPFFSFSFSLSLFSMFMVQWQMEPVSAGGNSPSLVHFLLQSFLLSLFVLLVKFLAPNTHNFSPSLQALSQDHSLTKCALNGWISGHTRRTTQITVWWEVTLYTIMARL